MILDTSGIDREHLVHFVADQYALEIVAITFQPKGEASYSYIATDRNDLRWVIKLQPMARSLNLEQRLHAVRFVHDVRGFEQALAPHQNRLGMFTCSYQDFAVSVFPFLEGETIEPGHQTDAYIYDVASLLATFHKHARMLPFPLPVETFDHPFEEQIMRALRTVEAPGQLSNPMQERLRELLLANRSDIYITLERIRQIQAEVRGLDLNMVLTHGDPNWENMLVDRSGTFHLLDWDDLGLGPPERDLVYVSDRPAEQFEAFLRRYLAINDTVTLHAEVFGFYHYRWVVQEIADYTMRILFRNVDPAENEHAWAELQNYIPAYHAAMEASIHQIKVLLERIAR